MAETFPDLQYFHLFWPLPAVVDPITIRNFFRINGLA